MADVFLPPIWRAGHQRRRYSKFRAVLVFLLFCGVCRLAGSAQAASPQLITPVAAPSSLPMPVTPEQLPSQEPAIVYQNGLLSITAADSTLGDILRGISTSTGAEIDIPPQDEERVVVRLGPGPARDVVASLLAGSKFNYILVGSEMDTSALTRVLLFLKPPQERHAQELATAHSGQRESPLSESENTAYAAEQLASPSDPALLMRSQQQMLQQRRQVVMEKFLQNTPSR